MSTSIIEMAENGIKGSKAHVFRNEAGVAVLQLSFKLDSIEYDAVRDRLKQLILPDAERKEMMLKVQKAQRCVDFCKMLGNVNNGKLP